MVRDGHVGMWVFFEPGMDGNIDGFL